MPKTGTSSIQETLYYELLDPGFVYCSFGEINGSYALSAFVGKTPYIASLRGLAGGADAYRRRMLERLRRSVERAQGRGAELIVSAEFCFMWGRQEHQAFRALAQQHGLNLQLVLYVRPPLDWLASSLAQNLKFGQYATHADLLQRCSSTPIRRQLGFTERLEMLAELYGPKAVTVRPFLRQQLAEGCVVRDFCRVVGLTRQPRRIHRQNEGLSLTASQCLHLRNLALGRPLRGAWELVRRDGLLVRLEQLFRHEPGLRLHAAVLGDLEPFVQQQLADLEQRHGVALPLSTAAADAGLTSLDSLLELSPAVHQRLQEATGAAGTPQQALAQLERTPRLDALLDGAWRLGRRQLRHALHGC
ncbi:MAG: hypothetical protein VKN13_04275 [Cyanobacteriota bacterium]|nr:hypothetical protein [Cyanobacteriota bacterium]